MKRCPGINIKTSLEAALRFDRVMKKLPAFQEEHGGNFYKICHGRRFEVKKGFSHIKE